MKWYSNFHGSLWYSFPILSQLVLGKKILDWVVVYKAVCGNKGEYVGCTTVSCCLSLCNVLCQSSHHLGVTVMPAIHGKIRTHTTNHYSIHNSLSVFRLLLGIHRKYINWLRKLTHATHRNRSSDSKNKTEDINQHY